MKFDDLLLVLGGLAIFAGIGILGDVARTIVRCVRGEWGR